MVTTPFVAAVEGLPYSGKSTLVRRLRTLLGGHAAPDYSDAGPLPPWPPRTASDVEAALQHFLLIERQRAQAAVRTSSAVVLLDRSPLTLIAHEYGMAAIGVPANPRRAVELYAKAAATGSILTPDAYIYVAVPDPITAQRRARRGPIAAHLELPAVRAAIDRACRTWLSLIPDQRRLLLDDDAPCGALAARAAAFVTAAAGAAAIPSWRELAC